MKTLTLPALCLLLPTLGAQTFQVATQPLAVSVPYGKVDIGDFNGDGRPDLAHVSLVANFLIAGGPGGVFATPVPLPGTFLGSWVQLADSNGDGQSEIWRCDANACVRMEHFASGFAVTATFGSARSMTCADFDEDGRLDIVLGADTGLKLARGDGQGGFLGEVTLAPPPVMSYVHCVTSDLNGDGHWDMVAAMIGSSRVLLGSGHGSFAMRTILPFGAKFRLADVDGDRRPDIVTAGVGLQPTVMLLRNLGNGQFAAPQPLTGLIAVEVVTADFDGDGLVDLVGANSSALWIARGLGGGQFAAPTSFPMPSQPYGLVAGDIDGDGRIEAVVFSDAISLHVMRLVDPTPPGLSAFGSGSPACAGTIGIRGTVEPLLGTAGFRVQCTNVPKDSSGMLAIGSAVPAGWQPLGLGLQFHLGSASVLGAMLSDDGGTASFALPLPGDPSFSGLTAHLQSFWFADASRGNTCSTASFDLASSRGLSVTLH